MRNIVIIFVSILLTSCVSVEYAQRGAENHQQMIYVDYVNNNNKIKVLVTTNISVREVVDTMNPDRKYSSEISNYFLGVDGMTKKNYYSDTQKSYEHAIIEAFEYCKRDNLVNYQEICELVMIGDFNATEYEKNYAKDIFNSNLYQITILNLGLNSSPLDPNSNLANCRDFDQKEITGALSPSPYAINSSNTLKKSFLWTDCKVNIRFNIDEILERYSRPKRFSKETI